MEVEALTLTILVTLSGRVFWTTHIITLMEPPLPIGTNITPKIATGYPPTATQVIPQLQLMHLKSLKFLDGGEGIS